MTAAFEDALNTILASANGGRGDGALDLDDVAHSIHHADLAGNTPLHLFQGAGFGVSLRLGREDGSLPLSRALAVMVTVRDGEWITVGAADSSGLAMPALDQAWPTELRALGGHISGWRKALLAWARRAESSDRVRAERERALRWVKINKRRFKIPSGQFKIPDAER